MSRVPRLKRTAGAPISALAAGAVLRVPFDGLTPAVAPGDRVRAGQVVAARADGAVRHCAWSGEVRAVAPWIEITGGPDEPQRLADGGVVETARAAGIVGMGGAEFPTFRKLELTRSARIVLVNGCESEPYVTCDSAVLAEHAASVEGGMRHAMDAVGATEGRIVADEERSGYPAGFEALLVERALGVALPPGKRPSDLGALVINVQTAAALQRAVDERLPLLERVVTVDGAAVGRPGNYRVAIGTPLASLLEAAETDLGRAAVLLRGGPMMGREADPHEPVGPGTIAVLALGAAECANLVEEPCLRCGRCETVCPYGLSACLMIESPDETLRRCMECGACQFACPAHRPLVRLLREQKAALAARARRPA